MNHQAPSVLLLSLFFLHGEYLAITLPSGDHFNITNVSSYNVLQLCHRSTKDPYIVGPSVMINTRKWGFPGGSVVNNPPVNAGATCSVPGPEDPTCHRASELWAAATEPDRQSQQAAAAETSGPKARTRQLEALPGRRPHHDWGAAPARCNRRKAHAATKIWYSQYESNNT